MIRIISCSLWDNSNLFSSLPFSKIPFLIAALTSLDFFNSTMKDGTSLAINQACTCIRIYSTSLNLLRAALISESPAFATPINILKSLATIGISISSSTCSVRSHAIASGLFRTADLAMNAQDRICTALIFKSPSPLEKNPVLAPWMQLCNVAANLL